jgi:cytochrome c556
MIKNSLRLAAAAALLALGPASIADDNPAHERHELMEGVRDAAKPVGQMLRGEADFDAETVMASLGVWKSAGEKFGDLFPEGSQDAEGTEAAPAIWEDREGFNAALDKWQMATAAAIEANPQTLDEARPVVGPIFQTCKGCHDTYRIED